MLINTGEINKVLVEAGTEIINRGKRYFEQGKVKKASFDYVDDQNFIAKTYVESTYLYELEVQKKMGVLTYHCSCPYILKGNKICKHIVAMLFDLYVNPDSYLHFEKKVEAKELFSSDFEKKTFNSVEENPSAKSIISYYENLEFDTKESIGTIKLVPVLSVLDFKDPDLEVSFQLGKNRMYILRDIYEFSDAVKSEFSLRYGKELEFKHSLDNFEENSKELVKFVVGKTSEYSDFSRLGVYSFNLNKRYRSFLKLRYGALDEFFEIMQGKEVFLENRQKSQYTFKIDLLKENPKLHFEIIDEGEKGIQIIDKNHEYYLFHGKEYLYVLHERKLYQTDEDFKKKIYPLLKELQSSDGSITIMPNEATSLCSYVVPYLKEMTSVKIPEGMLEKYKAEKLATKAYLDIDENANIIADIKFCYGENEFNPFAKEEYLSCNRNSLEEMKIKRFIQKYRFLINQQKENLYLTNEEDIYQFLSSGIHEWMEKFEVLVTERLKNKQIMTPKTITMGVRIENDFLEMDFENLGVDESELREIFKRYQLKKKYYRLKDGSYINLDSSGIDMLAQISDKFNLSEKEMIQGNVKLPKYRAIYLDSLLKENENIILKRDHSFKEMIHHLKDVDETDFTIPASLQTVLRSYQKRGFCWLKTLAKYQFGGILADDMGLGKTLQIISILVDERKKTGKTSLIVCPSSLYINWEREMKKFSPSMKILVVSGTAEQRENAIKTMEQYDAVITSYDLLKRDVEHYKNFLFKYVIADEAQYIKNNNTKNAKALKKLKSEVRFALTGTPIENSLAELWSIFDFIMPGYLFSYRKFKEEYEMKIIKENDTQTMEKLKKLVAPFILRRIKKEVLKELPEKTETIMYSKMNEEQNKIYNAFLLSIKEQMEQEIKQNGFQKSRMKILALMTRLRQICCHPSLCVENYHGDSSKLEQCIELIEGAISAGHKILLFSGFTSMFPIMIKEFEKRKIRYLILTGQTKVDSRIEMVDEFNKEEEIKVFLISLKAGGTGLNLTGADIVIHYDPWWNLSAQNQATDRAYRIGQRNNVQVFKLITENSIEEKIQKLQDKKRSLSDSIIQEGETFISQMTEKEILELFEE